MPSQLRFSAGDVWGGLAAMLVALPSAIAFGVTIFSPLGGSYAAYGALAGILGVTALGIVASTFGGTNRLISAPCAPAAAVLSGFATEFMRGGASPDSILFLLTAIALLSSGLQLAYGTVGLGRQHRARFDRRPVEQHGAATALAGVASDVRARQAQLVAQHVGEQGAGFDLQAVRLSVDLEFDVHGVSS